MGTSAVQYKIMPKSVDANLKKIKDSIKKVIQENGGVYSKVEEQPIAFGLKALLFSFAYPEEKEIDELENKFKKINEISSVEMTDYRRALG